jgi:hypothetical protein
VSATVVWVENKGENAILVMSDDTRVWTPDKAKADALVGKEIPADWTIKQGQYGPQALPPRDKKFGGGAPAAFRNSEEGQRREQESIHRSVALTQAVAAGGSENPDLTLARATKFYEWLSGTAVATVSDNGEAKPEPRPQAQASPSTSGGAEPEGEAGSTPPAAPHEHMWVPSPKLKSFDICAVPNCYLTQKRVSV